MQFELSHCPGSRRVLLVSASSGSKGGGELYLDMLAEGLSGLGYDVLSLLSSHSRMDALAKLLNRWGPVHRTELITNTYDRKLRSFDTVIPRRSSVALARLLKSFNPDVIHLNKQNVEDGLDLLVASRRSSLPTVCTIHVTRSMEELGSTLGRARDWVARRMLRRFEGEYIAIAHTCRAQFVQFIKAKDEGSLIHAVPNGVRAVPNAYRSSFRSEWGVGSEDLVIGCVARIEAQKNPLFALDLLNRLPSNVHLVWVGDGQQREAFEQRVHELGLADRVHLDGWRSDAPERMSGFDIFLLPSRYEGFPFAVLEAMAAGLPCVVSDVDGTREAVENGLTGYLCPAASLDEWLVRLGELVANPELRRRMGEAALHRVTESFSLESMAKGTADVYEKAIQRAAQEQVGVS
jgi:glycosyltransferase involved in cell wall biosynthesis